MTVRSCVVCVFSALARCARHRGCRRAGSQDELADATWQREEVVLCVSERAARRGPSDAGLCGVRTGRFHNWYFSMVFTMAHALWGKKLTEEGSMEAKRKGLSQYEFTKRLRDQLLALLVEVRREEDAWKAGELGGRQCAMWHRPHDGARPCAHSSS